MKYLLGWSSVVGAALFVALTAVLWVLFYENIDVASELMLGLIAGSIAALFFRKTRKVAAGFVFAAVIMTAIDSQFTEIWWRPVVRHARRITRPATQWMNAREEYSEWVKSRRGLPLEVKDALVLLQNLQSGCVPSYTSQTAEADLPKTVADIFSKPDCDRFEPMLLDSMATFPARYSPTDTGWRWTYGRRDDSSDRFRIVLQPDRLLELPGPILEVTGNGWYWIRNSADAPLTMLKTPVPMMKRVRECIQLAAAAVDPKYPVQWEWLSNPSYLHPVCRELHVDDEQDSAEGDRVILVRTLGGEPNPLGPTTVHYRPLSPGRFEIRGWSFGRRYLVDADGTLHAASARGPGSVDDGPPTPCEIEPGRACT